MDEKSRAIEDDDVQCVVSCRNGDTEAFGVLVERHQKKMLNVAYRMLGDYDEACDIVQDAFVSAFRAIKTFRGEARFSSWLYGIVMNHAKNRLKQRGHQRRRESVSIDDAEMKGGGPLAELQSRDESVLERFEKKELEERVQACIGALDGEQKEVLVLRDIQGFSYEDIGEMLNLADGTVKSRLFRARNAMKECLRGVIGDLQ